jgi:hypothetical protein
MLLLGALVCISIPGLTAPRTFVSSAGSDAAPCTLSAPCRSFTAALVQTDANGEIVVLDSAGYGSVTIDKSVAITAPAGVYAGVSTPTGGTGITINGAGVRVVLRNLTIGPAAGGGDVGVKFIQGDELHVEGGVIANLSMYGIHAPAQLSTARLFVVDSIVRDNAQGGIVAEDNVEVALDRVRLEQNGTNPNLQLSGNGSRTIVRDSSVVGGNGGISLSASGASAVATLTVERSSVAHSASGGIGVVAQSNASASFQCTRCEIADNTGPGVSVAAVSAGHVSASIVDTTVTGNAMTGLEMPNLDGAGGVQIAHSVLTRNGSSGVKLTGGMTAFALASISDSTISQNGGSGVESYGPGGFALLSGTTIWGNVNFGVVSQNGANATTRGNNNINGNGAGDTSGPFNLVPLN